jgi:hypothetical protein
MTATAFSNIYRARDTDLTNSTLPVMTITAAVDTTLASGTYWLDWMVGGSSGLEGPYVPPITILGQKWTGDGRYYDPSVSGWKNIVDPESYMPQGMPFRIEGTVLPPTPTPTQTPTPIPTPTPRPIVRVVASQAVVSAGDPFTLDVSVLPVMDRPFDAYAVILGPAGAYSIKFGNVLVPGVSPIARGVLFLPYEYNETILNMTIPSGVAGNYQAIVGLVDTGAKVNGVQDAFALDVAYISVN